MKDIYIKFGSPLNGNKIEGESRDVDHKKPWFEVSSWTHVIRQPKSATASTAGGHTAERCEHGEMVFTKDLDSISPQLWEACSAGTLYEDVEIHFMRANGATDKRVTYLTIKLKKVIVSSVTPEVVGEGLPTETFGLKYAAVKWDYVRQMLNGKIDSTVTGSWNLATNKTDTTLNVPN